MDVDTDATAALHHLHRVADVCDTALAEDVHLDEAYLLGRIHVVLRRREALGWQVEGSKVGDRLFGDEHTAGMDGALTREVVETLGKRKDLLTDEILLCECLRVTFHLVDLAFGQAKHLAQLAAQRVVLEGDRRTQQRHMLLPIFLEDVGDDGVPIFPREVEVEVGRTAPLGVEETLKVQVQFYRVHVGDLQAVGHHAVGPAATPHMVETLFHGKLDNLPGDEEISAKAFLLYDIQFLLDTTIGGLVGRAIAVGHSVESQLAQQFTVVVGIACETTFALHTRVNVDFTFLKDTLRVLNELRIERVSGPQPFGRQQNLIGGGTGLGVEARDQHIPVDGAHALVQLEVGLFREGDGLHGYQFFERLAGKHLGQLGEAHAEVFIRFQLVLTAFPEGIDHEDIIPFGCQLGIGLLGEVVLGQETVQLGETLVVFGQGHIEQLVAVAHLHTHDGPDALFLTFEHKVGNPHRRVDVGQRQDGVAHRGGLPDQVRNRHRTVAQAVI